MRARTFWGLLIIGIGAVLLLERLGILPGNIWSYVWPLVLIAFGTVVLLASMRRRNAPVEVMNEAVPLGNAQTAHVRLQHGAGELYLGADDVTNGEHTLVEGSFGGGVESIVNNQGNRADVVLRSPVWRAPWDWFISNDRLNWDVRLTPVVPLDLDIDTGASRSQLDLTGLRVQTLNLHTGASAVQIGMPVRAGNTRARVESGAASVDIAIPPGVAAHIDGRIGVGELKVDQTRFPYRNGSYESPDFLSAPNRIELHVEGGVGAVTVQ